MDPCPPGENVQSALREIENELKITAWAGPVFVKERQRKYSNYHFFFTAPSNKRDDDFANDLAECILLLAEVFYGQLFTWTSTKLAFPFRSTKLRKRKGIAQKALIESVDLELEDSHLIRTENEIFSTTRIPDPVVALSWKATPILMRNPSLRLSAAFIVHSQYDFYVYPGQLQESIIEGNWSPRLSFQMARWESAYQNAYKAVEAVIGDPPKDETKFQKKLLANNINPTELVGYQAKQPISEVIRDMNRIRDTKAAHGSTPNRGINLNQMVEFQECARYVFQCALEHSYKGNLYDIAEGKEELGGQ
jgi:hypothetical protein